MTTYVIRQTAAYEIEAENAEAALTAFLDIEGDSVLLPVNVEERSVLDADGIETGVGDKMAGKFLYFAARDGETVHGTVYAENVEAARVEARLLVAKHFRMEAELEQAAMEGVGDLTEFDADLDGFTVEAAALTQPDPRLLAVAENVVSECSRARDEGEDIPAWLDSIDDMAIEALSLTPVPTAETLYGAIVGELRVWRKRQAPLGQDNENRDQEEADSVVETLEGILKAANEPVPPAEIAAADKAALGFALRNAQGAISTLLHQVEQMRGMFNDEDGTIQEAVDAGEAAEIETQNALEALGLAQGVGAEALTIAVTVSGGVLQWAGSDSNVGNRVRLIVVDYDQDGVEEGRLVNMAADDEPRPEWASVYEERVCDDAQAVGHIIAKRDERELREARFEAGQCVHCEAVLTEAEKDAGGGNGVCGKCIGGYDDA